MLANWKEKLNKESNERLFEIFSETDRINVEPQLYCGQHPERTFGHFF